jgi:hypothetical protein
MAILWPAVSLWHSITSDEHFHVLLHAGLSRRRDQALNIAAKVAE